MAPRTPRGPLTSLPQSPQGSSSFTGLSSPGPAVSPENLICSQDPKTRHRPRLSVQSFSLASELQTQGSSHLPDLVTWGLIGLKKWWQKQTTIPPIPPPTSAITLPPRPHTPGRSALTWRPLVPPLEPLSTCLHHPCGLSHFSPPASHPGPLVRWPWQPPHCLSASSTLHPWSSLPSSHSSQRDASRESGHDTVSLRCCKGFSLYLGLNPPACHLTRDPKAYVRAPLHPSVTSLGFLCSPPAWPPCKP